MRGGVCGEEALEMGSLVGGVERTRIGNVRFVRDRSSHSERSGKMAGFL